MTLTTSERANIQKLLNDAKTTLASAKATLVTNQQKLVTAQANYDAIIHSASLPGISLTDQIVLLGITATTVVASTGNLYFANFGDGTRLFQGTGPVAAALFELILAIADASVTPFTRQASLGRGGAAGSAITSFTPGILATVAKPLFVDLPPAISRAKISVQEAQVLVDSLSDTLLHA